MEWLDKLMDKLEPKKIIKNSGKPQALGSAPTMYSIGEAGNTNLPSVPNGLENLKGIAAAMPKPPDNTGNEGPTPIPTSLWSKGHIDKGSTYEVFPASKEEPAGLTPGEMLNPEETGRVAPSEYGGIISTPTGKIYNIEKSKSPLTAEENIALNKQRGEDYSRYLDEKLAGIDTGIAQDRYNDYLRNYESTIEKNKSRYAKMASIASSDILMKNMSPGESKAFRTEFDALGQAIPQMQKDYGDKIKEGITAGAARETFLAQPGREITEAKTKAETEEAIARSG